MTDSELIAKHWRKYSKEAFYKHKQMATPRPLEIKRSLPPQKHLHVSKEYDQFYEPEPVRKKQMLVDARLNQSNRSSVRHDSDSSFMLNTRPQSVISQVKQQAYEVVKQAEIALREEKENTQVCYRKARRGSLKPPRRSNLHQLEALEDFKGKSGISGMWMREKLMSRSHRRVI